MEEIRQESGFKIRRRRGAACAGVSSTPETPILPWRTGWCARTVWGATPEATSPTACAGWESGAAGGAYRFNWEKENNIAVTLYELSLEYEQTAASLRRRIVELEQAGKQAPDEGRRLQLEGRVRPLRSMYRDVRAVARHLEHYYEKHTPGRTAQRGR